MFNPNILGELFISSFMWVRNAMFLGIMLDSAFVAGKPEATHEISSLNIQSVILGQYLCSVLL